jgi:hypothetical protein
MKRKNNLINESEVLIQPPFIWSLMDHKNRNVIGA